MRVTNWAVAVVLLAATTCVLAEDRSADERAIRKVDSEMVAALNVRDVDQWLSHFADDARMLPPGEPPVIGKDAIRKLIEGYLALPTFAVAHHLESVVVATSGDLAYDTYSYEMGKPVVESGKDVSLYRKGPDGSWKLIIDMWSENSSASSPP